MLSLWNLTSSRLWKEFVISSSRCYTCRGRRLSCPQEEDLWYTYCQEVLLQVENKREAAVMVVAEGVASMVLTGMMKPSLSLGIMV
jgi:hypothetical protein